MAMKRYTYNEDGSPPEEEELVEFKCAYSSGTDKAWKAINSRGETVWLPKSLCTPHNGVMRGPAWIAEKKEIETN